MLRTQACWAWLLESSAGCSGFVGRPRRRIAVRSPCCCGPWQLISAPAAGLLQGIPASVRMLLGQAGLHPACLQDAHRPHVRNGRPTEGQEDPLPDNPLALRENDRDIELPFPARSLGPSRREITSLPLRMPAISAAVACETSPLVSTAGDSDCVQKSSCSGVSQHITKYKLSYTLVHDSMMKAGAM